MDRETIIRLEGRIDTTRAPEVDRDIRRQLDAAPGAAPVLDLSGLEYISSAGLSVLLRLCREHPGTRAVGARAHVYETLEVTGFTDIMEVAKAVTAPDGAPEAAPGETDGPDEITVDADVARLDQVQAFIGARLEAMDCPMKASMQIQLAVEEIFVNIASYAYQPGTGTANIRFEACADPKAAVITFADRGKPYDPLAKADPDVSLPAAERDIGGLGIFLTKKTMDEVRYEYAGGENILTLRKLL